MNLHRSLGLLVLAGIGIASTAGAQPWPIAPGLYFHGNLRVHVECAEYFATPEQGLRVTVDGAALDAIGTNGQTSIGYSENGSYSTWEPTDVGFVAPPGPHHLSIAAPGCASDERDLEISAIYPKLVDGRLAMVDPALGGPVGAPNGGGLTLGAFTANRSATLGQTTDLWGGRTAVTTDVGSTHGVWLAFSYEHRSFVFANDMRFGWGATSGTVQTIGANPSFAYTGVLHYTGTTGLVSDTLRLGARWPMHDVAFAAGSGLGGDLSLAFRDVDKTGLSDTTIVDADAAHDMFDAHWYVPAWAALTIKPSCDWGAQILASYDIHPSALDESALSASVGFVYQPSAACAGRAAVRVTPP